MHPHEIPHDHHRNPDAPRNAQYRTNHHDQNRLEYLHRPFRPLSVAASQRDSGGNTLRILISRNIPPPDKMSKMANPLRVWPS